MLREKVHQLSKKRGPDKILSEFEQFTILQTLIHKPSSYHIIERERE